MTVTATDRPAATAGGFGLNALAARVAAGNADNGWHDRYRALAALDDEAGILEHVVSRMMMIVSEAAEAVEEIRGGRGYTETWHQIDGTEVYRVTDASGADWTERADGWTGDLAQTWTGRSAKPEGFPAEIADIVIRCLDVAGMLGIDLDAIVAEKLAYNATRGRMHGGKRV